MTFTDSGSATATDTFPTCAIFWPTKPIIGGLVQIRSDTYVVGWEEYPAWTGPT